MQIKLLKAKTAKLVEFCGENSANVNQRKCTRRMQHVLRSLKFIGKASKGNTFTQLTPEEVNEAQTAADAARVQIGDAILSTPEKRNQLSRLVEVLKKDQKSLKQNPKAAVTRTLKVLEDDILPDDADPAVAEEKIKKMELDAKPADPEDEEVFKTHVKELENDMANAPANLHQIFDENVQKAENEVIEEEEVLGNTTESSLMQRGDGKEAVVKVVGFVAIAVLLVMAISFAIDVLWTLLVFWIVASIFGCTAGALLGGSDKEFGVSDKQARRSEFREWGGCIVGWVSYPFVLMFRGLKWMAKKVFKSSLAQIDAGSGSNVRLIDGNSSKPTLALM